MATPPSTSTSSSSSHSHSGAAGAAALWFTAEQVATHNASDDCWVIHGNYVYDVTPLIQDPELLSPLPFSDVALLECAGKEVSGAVKQYFDSTEATEHLLDFRRGRVALPLRGQIVLFSIKGCAHCREAKLILETNAPQYPVHTVGLDESAGSREWLVSKTGRRMVPQLFFNHVHVPSKDALAQLVNNNASDGRFDELLRLVRDEPPSTDAPPIPFPAKSAAGAPASPKPSLLVLGDDRRSSSSNLSRSADSPLSSSPLRGSSDGGKSFLVAAARQPESPAPPSPSTSPRATRPTATTSWLAASPPSNDLITNIDGSPDRAEPSSSSPLDFECEKDDMAELVLAMRDPNTGVGIRDRRYRLKTYKKVFVGRRAVQWLMENRNATREEAIRIGNDLHERHFFQHVNAEHDFKDEYLFYRFLADESSTPLNMSVMSDCLPRPAVEVADELRVLIGALYDQYLSADGKSVDYDGIAASDDFKTYLRLSAELQRIQMVGMSREQTLAMFINLYNALVIHAYIQIGPPTSAWKRRKFFHKAAYKIGGHTFSLNDIEHGILRGNRKQPMAFQRPFGPSDPRRVFSLPSVDPRIHFALVCGAKGCPPIKNYDHNNIDAELDDATIAFFEGECLLFPERHSVQLSMLLKWYRQDFGSTNEQILQWVARYLDPERRTTLEQMLAASESIKITYSEYDWTHNSKKSS